VANDFRGIGGQIRAARRARGVSQVRLSKQLGLGQGTLSRAETTSDVRLATLLQIARALDLEVMLVPRRLVLPRRLVPAVDAIVRHGVAPALLDVDDDKPYDEAYDAPAGG
jgi:transcriptional regulator with XRE-family HTH domain